MSYDFQIEKDTVIIPLHSPNDSPDELVASDSDTNITRAVVHVSYEPKQVEVKTETITKLSDDKVISHSKALKEPTDKDSVIESTIKNMKILKENNEYSCKENSHKITNNLVKLEDSTSSPQFSR